MMNNPQRSLWRTTTFAEAVQINPSVSLKRGETYPFLDMASVSSGQRYASAREVRAFTGGGSRFTSGDTLMARITPCLENGKICRYSGEGPASGSTEFIVIRGRPNITTDDFAYYLTQSHTVRDYAISKMTGSSGRQRVPTDVFERLEVNLPPLPIQKRIAHILGTLDDKIELNRRMNETLEAMARAIFKSWFIDFDPVKRNMARNQPSPGLRPPSPTGRGAGGEGADALFPSEFQNSELGPIPKGWGFGKLGEVTENPRRPVHPEEIEPATPYIGLEHMPRRSIALWDWGTVGGLESGKFRFNNGEILFGKLRPYFQKVGLAPLEGVCSTDILVIKPKHPDWLGLVLSHVSSDDFVSHTDARSAGTKMPRTNWNDMADYQIVIPPTEIAEAHTTVIRPHFDNIIQNVRQNHRLATVRDALLPKLLSGELAASATEKHVSEVT